VATGAPAGNGEVVLRTFDAINRRDVDAVLADASDDVVIDWSASVSPYRGVYRGRREVKRFYADFLDSRAELSWEAEDLRDLPVDRVIVTNHLRAVGRGSGVRVDARGAHVWRFRDGKAAAVRLFQTPRRSRSRSNGDLTPTRDLCMLATATLSARSTE
jgi:ketosteroid isomerase-like protein